MKVAVVFPYYAHYRAPIIDLLNRDDEIEYFFFGGENVSPQFQGMKLMNLTDYKNFIRTENLWFLKYFSLQLDLKKEIKKREFDCVIIFGDWKYLSTWRTLLYLSRRKIPALFWSHGFRENKKTLNDMLKNRYFNLFNGGFVFDNRAKKIFTEKKYPNSIDVINNSLDFKYQNRILEQLQINDPKATYFEKKMPYVVFSGRLTQNKNLDLIIKALNILKKKSISINLILIGDGDYKVSLESLTKQYNLENQVVFFGSCYDEEVIASCFKYAVVCVIPSAVGLSAIHSLTYGCPVITDDNYPKHGPEVESIVENLSGKYYQTGSDIALSNLIEFFLNLSLNERDIYKSNCINIIKQKYTAGFQKEIINARVKELIQKIKNKNE